MCGDGCTTHRRVGVAVTQPAAPPAWRIEPQGAGAALAVSGDWVAESGLIPDFPPDGFGAHAQGTVAITMAGAGRWDSGLIEFLWDAKRAAAGAGLTIDGAALPDAARKLLGLLPDTLPAPPLPAPPRTGLLARTGEATLALLAEIGAVTALLAATVQSGVLALSGQTRVRAVDVLANMRDAGPSALLIVSVVNFLVGAILAFVGAAQLRRFAAGAYVANLVGIAVVREMAAIMTAIVMAGRTGGAYAARIATMQGNEELDALRVMGIPVAGYILLPSILGLAVTMPLLYLYGSLAGIAGGLVVAMLMLNVTTAGYLHQTAAAVPLDQFAFGFVKSFAFALLIGVTSCRMGLKAGRSSADVGIAATRAVVIGIVGVIALDAVFAVAAETMGI